MKLEELYPNFLHLSDADKLSFVSSYRHQRELDVNKSVVKKSHVKKNYITLTDEDKVMMKLLGIKARDIIALRALSQESESEEESSEDDAVLFDESEIVLDDE